MAVKYLIPPKKERKPRQKAYQCHICETADVDDVTDAIFCKAGYWPKCGDPKGCLEHFRPIEGKGRIGVHR